MDIKELTNKMHELVNSKGWYEKESKRPQTAKNIAISLSLEAAEVLEHFQWHENGYSKEKLELELADVMLYLLQLANIVDIDLEEAVMKKISKNYQRSWDEEND